MDYSIEFVRELFHSRLAASERMSAAARFRSGPELWDFACSISKAGIRHDHPEATEEEVDRLLDERIARGKKIRGEIR